VAAIRIEVDARELSKMSAWVAGLQRQLPYASSRALNDTARQAAADLNRSTSSYFRRPTPFTQRSYQVSKWSRKDDLSAELTLRPIQASYLVPSIQGGIRPQRPSEMRLGLAGNQAWRPGVDARLNSYGNIPKTALVAALRGASGQGGRSRFFQLDQSRGRLWPGVYQRMPGGKVQNVLSFGSLPTIPQRWPVERIARESVGRNWPVNLSRWLDSARPKP
jgi:hypothetical protein